LIIKQGVFGNLGDNLRHRHGLADKLHSFGRASLGAAPAVPAFVSRPLQLPFEFPNRFVGAGHQTLLAANAALPAVEALGCRTQAFGIVAPPARQGATLKKNGGPNTGTIVNGILFYVENFSGYSGCHKYAPFARFANKRRGGV
jgi:hypothetical protein